MLSEHHYLLELQKELADTQFSVRRCKSCPNALASGECNFDPSKMAVIDCNLLNSYLHGKD